MSDDDAFDASDASDVEAPAAPTSAAKKGRVVKPLSKKKLRDFQATHENRGVCYISRLPPYLKPSALREMLSGMGTEVLRIYLALEEQSLRAKRVKSGGNKKKSYTEGWVEFADKKRALRISRTLNNTPMATPGKRRSFYASDLWNIKYLHKFKWSNLTEKVSYEARVKQDKMRAEITQAKKETSFYLKKVGQAKAIDAMEARKKKKAAAKAEAEGGAAAGEALAAGADGAKRKKRSRDEAATATTAAAAPAAQSEADGLQEIRRRFKQRKVAPNSGGAGAAHVDARLLMKSMLG